MGEVSIDLELISAVVSAMEKAETVIQDRVAGLRHHLRSVDLPDGNLSGWSWDGEHTDKLRRRTEMVKEHRGMAYQVASERLGFNPDAAPVGPVNFDDSRMYADERADGFEAVIKDMMERWKKGQWDIKDLTSLAEQLAGYGDDPLLAA